jgi:peptide/nickel transport system substrate-binding protein
VFLALCALLLLVGAIAACGKSTTSSSSGKTSTSGITLQSTTPPGTHTVAAITWDLPLGEPTTLDPAKAGDYGPCFVSSQLHDTLLRYSPDWKTLGPGIAESWSYPNPLTLVYKIRDNAHFWDGHPVTAADVVFSLQRNMNPKTASVWTTFYSNVKSIQQTGPWQVTVHFTKPDELFNKEMTTDAGGIVEKAYVEKVGEAKYGSGMDVMGSGPYELKSWVSGSDIVLEANPHYWDPSLQPKVQQVTIKFVTDTSTLTSALLSGEIDGAYEVPPTTIPALKSAPDGKLYFGPGLSVTELAISNPKGPLGNPAIRGALSMALDRSAIAAKVYNGAALPNETLTPPTAWDPQAVSVYKQAYDVLPTTSGTASDIAAAKAIVASQPGATKPTVLAVETSDQTELELASIVQQAATEIGLKMTLKPMQPMAMSNFFYIPSYRKGIDAGVTLGFLDIPDPLDYTSYFFGAYQLFNWINYNNPQVNKDLTLARESYDPVKRAEYIVAAQAIYTKATVVIPLTSDDEILFMNNRISGAPAAFSYIYLPSLAMIGGTH